MKKIENPNPSNNSLKKESFTTTVKGVNELLNSRRTGASGKERRSWITLDTGRPEIVAHEVIIM